LSKLGLSGNLVETFKGTIVFIKIVAIHCDSYRIWNHDEGVKSNDLVLPV
jgi:hypothetical protein